MAETPARMVRVPAELVDQAAAAAKRIGEPADFPALVRAGLVLIGSGAVSAQDLSWALERARLRAGWPPRAERTGWPDSGKVNT